MKQLSREAAIEYLSSVVDLESRFYVWKQTMAQENEKMRNIVATKNQALATCRDSEKKIKELDEEYAKKEKNRKEYIEKVTNEVYRLESNLKKKKLIFRGLIFLNVFAWISFIFASFISETREEAGPFVLFLCFVVVISFFAFPAIYIFKKITENDLSSARSALTRASNTNIDSLKQITQNELFDKYSEAKETIERLTAEETECRKRQEVIFENFNMVKSQKLMAYDMGILDERYHKFQALYSMYDYLKTGICLTLYGHGGAIEKYEDDLKFGLVYSLLMDIRNIAEDIADTQKELRDYAREITRTLNQIESNTQAIMDYSQDTNASLRQINERLYRIENY